jgi:hypothetical protein
MLRWIVFVALLVSSFAIAGCGGKFWAVPDCIEDPNNAFSCPPTPGPTDDPSTPDPAPAPGCIDRAILLYPFGNNVPADYSGTMYVTVPTGQTPGSFLAIQVGQTNPANNVAQFEVGTRLAAVSGLPPFVAAPPRGFSGVYSSSNLPLVATWGTGITMIDTRTPSYCAPFTFATLNVRGTQRMTR